MSEEKDKTAENMGTKGRKLSDEELGQLLDDVLDESSRNSLVSRLQGDPESAEILAVAASVKIEKEDAARDDEIERMMGRVRDEFRKPTGLCPNCSGDLHAGGKFCPHCRMAVAGQVLTCFSCRKPVVEGSFYCPHCGSVFRSVEKTSFFNSPLLLLVLGLASFLCAIIFRFLWWFFVPFGSLVLAPFILDLWYRLKFRNIMEAREEADKEEEEKRRGRMSG